MVVRRASQSARELLIFWHHHPQQRSSSSREGRGRGWEPAAGASWDTSIERAVAGGHRSFKPGMRAHGSLHPHTCHTQHRGGVVLILGLTSGCMSYLSVGIKTSAYNTKSLSSRKMSSNFIWKRTSFNRLHQQWLWNKCIS